MKKKLDLWVQSTSTLKKIIMELKIAILIIMVGFLNAIATPSYSGVPNVPVNELQQKTISGAVSDEKGNPLPGVSVVVKGTTQGTLTDASGKYSLSNFPQNATLVFSFVGMTTQEITSDGKTTIDVIMKEEAFGLNEVIVIGYGTAKKSDLTGSVVRIDMAGTEKGANVGILQALQGTTPGVNVTGGGAAGADQQLSIRGQTSLSASDNPLIVLDGIIYNGSISDINIQDVESIDVLKDASAAAVYGSRSANGVLLITTKKGKTEKPLFNFNTYYGLQDMSNSPMKVMNGQQYAARLIDFYWESALYTWYRTMPTSSEGRPVRADVNDPNVVVSYLRSQEEKDNYLAGNTTDWVKEVIRQAPIQNYDLSVSGRTARSNYYLSGSYVDQKGILLNDQFTRSTLHTNFENKITNWITLGVNSSYTYRDYSGLETPLSAARTASPFGSMYNSIGGYPMYLSGGELYQPHPLSNLTVDNMDLRNSLFTTLSAKIEIPGIKGLTYDFNYSNTYNTSKNNTYYPSTVAAGSNNNGLASKVLTEERSWIYNNILTYVNTFGADHKINATLLYSREYRRGETSNLQATGFQNPALLYNGVQLGQVPTISSGAWEEKSISYMGRLNYTFRNRYLITGTIRKDGFSGFGPNKKFATFPSLSLGWVVSEESFLKSQEWLNFLKLRASVGVNGNQGIGRYSSFSKMATTAYVYNGITNIAVYPNTLGNADLGWESTLSYNLGLDYTLLKSRILGSIDVYKAQTTDVLVSRSIPTATGYTSVWTNIGGISNKGIELGLTTVNTDGPLRWETKFQFSLNRDKITKLYGGETDKDIGNSWFVGEPISAIYDYKMTGGVWTENELYNNQIITGFYPGQFRLADLNQDGLIDANNDRSIIGYRTPSYRFGINNTLSYKSFVLSFFINSIQGGDNRYLADNSAVLMASTTADHAYRENVTAVRQYWTPDNGVTNAPGIYNAPQRVAGLYQSKSFVRLQDVTLSYRFNENIIKTLRIDGLELYVNGKNLHTWTKWSGWDPETGSNTPMMRTIVGGARLSF